MWTMMERYRPALAPDGAGTGGSSGTPAAGAPPPAAPPGAGVVPAAAAPWYGDKIDEVTRGFWQNKGIDPSDPIAVATKLTEFYRNSERFIGAPPEEMIRIPKPNAPEADISAYWGKIGVPAEAKDYDLSTVKFADGKELGAAADWLRKTMHDSRVPKDRATQFGQEWVKQRESEAAAKLAGITAMINTEREALKKNWGTNYAYNDQISQRALEDLGRAAGLNAEQIKLGWDALSTVGGIGASYAKEMLRTIGARLNTSPAGESPFLAGGQTGQQNQVMSSAQAKARIDELKMDKDFYKRLVTDREVAARREWDDLHKIAFRPAA